jgi:hypothetical protein
VEGAWANEVGAGKQSVIGIGTNNSTRKDGRILWTDGTMTLPESTPALIQNRGPKAVVTVEALCSSVQNITATATLTSTCALAVVKGTGDVVLTLPAANARGTDKSQTVTIKNLKTSGTLTLQRAGTDSLFLYGGTTAQTNTTISTGAMMQVLSNGNNEWYVLI